MEKRFLLLNDIGCYKRSLTLSNFVWQIVIALGWFEKKTIGSQFVNAVDSISANIAEGFGQYGKKDKCKFYYYSFGSVKESLDWNEKSKIRQLISEEQYKFILKELQQLPREIHQLIKFTNEKLTK